MAAVVLSVVDSPCKKTTTLRGFGLLTKCVYWRKFVES